MNLALGVPAIALSLALAVMTGRDTGRDIATSAVAPPLQETDAVASDDARVLMEQALTRVVPGDVRDVRITDWHVLPIGPLAATVLGKANLDAGGPAPIAVSFRADLDLDRGQVLQLSYRMVGSSPPVQPVPLLDEGLRSRIGGEVVAQFPDQPMDFRIAKITSSTRTKTHLIIAGEGVSDFFAEGRARTPFVATFAIPSAQLVKLDYDLIALPDEDSAHLAVEPAYRR